MKQLITAVEVKQFAEKKESILYVEKNSIITPAARDAAKDYGIEIVVGSKATEIPVGKACGADRAQVLYSGATTQGSIEMDPEVLARIVGEVIACLQQPRRPAEINQEVDPSGLRLVRAGSVELENCTASASDGRVKVRELFGRKGGNGMSAGIMTMEDTSVSWERRCAETRYILDGNLDCVVNGKKYSGKAGDVFFIPAHANVTFATTGKVKIFYTASPL